ncbi:protein max [Empidonax traillii]|nr:protein max [Empidonax traillii]
MGKIASGGLRDLWREIWGSVGQEELRGLLGGGLAPGCFGGGKPSSGAKVLCPHPGARGCPGSRKPGKPKGPGAASFPALAAKPAVSRPRSRPRGPAGLPQCFPEGILGVQVVALPGATPVPPSQADKRAHHNALERKRRDHIKDSFHSLRDSVPSLQGEKASRAQILDKATEYIQYMRRKNHTHQQDIDDLKRQNALLEQQVRALEKARSSAQLQASYPADNSLYTNPKGSAISAFDGGSDSSSDSEPDEPQSRKKLRMEAS